MKNAANIFKAVKERMGQRLALEDSPDLIRFLGISPSEVLDFEAKNTSDNVSQSKYSFIVKMLKMSLK